MIRVQKRINIYCLHRALSELLRKEKIDEKLVGHIHRSRLSHFSPRKEPSMFNFYDKNIRIFDIENI